MKCSESRIYLSAYLDGELEGRLLDRFEYHLGQCGECRQELRELKIALQALRQLPPTPAAVGFPERVTERLEGNSIPVADLVHGFPRWITGRAVAAAAVLLLVFSMGFGLARLAGVRHRSLEEELRRLGLRKVQGEWVPLRDYTRMRKGLVWVDGRWVSRDKALPRLLQEADYVVDGDTHWVPREDFEKREQGLVRHHGEWRTPAELVALTLKRQGLVKYDGSWVTPEQKVGAEQRKIMVAHGYLFADEAWVSPEEYEEKLLAREGLVELEAGGWDRKEHVEKGRSGFIRVNERWVEPKAFVRVWMEKNGYERDEEGHWSRAAGDDGRGAVARKEDEDSPWSGLQPSPDLLRARPAAVQAQARYVKTLRNRRTRGTVRGGTELTRFRPAHGAAGWRVKLKRSNAGQALGTPAFAGNRVFIGGGMSSRVAYAFDAVSGRDAWAIRLSDNGPSNPVVLENQVYYATESCTLYALDTATGRTRWGRYLAGSVRAMPMTAQEDVLISFPGSGHILAAFDARRGRLKWHTALPGDSFTAPCIDRERVFVTTRAGTVHAYKLRDGVCLWAKDIHALTPPTVVGTDKLLIRRAVRLGAPPDPREYAYGAVYGEVVSLLDARTGRFVEPVLGEPKRLQATSLAELFPDRPAPAGEEPAAKDDGRLHVRTGRLGPMAVGKGLAFATRGNVLEALDLGSGKSVWTQRLGEEPNPALRMGGSYRSHSDPCVAGDRVFVGTLEGRLYCLEARSGRIVWAEDLGSPIGNYATPHLTMAQVQPIVAHGRVYLTTLQGELICYDTGNRQLDGPHMWGNSRPKARRIRIAR